MGGVEGDNVDEGGFDALVAAMAAVTHAWMIALRSMVGGVARGDGMPLV